MRDDGIAVFVEGNGQVVGDGGGVSVGQAGHVKSAEAAVVIRDGAAQFLVRGRIHLGGHDAEIEADIDEDGADRTATVLGGDLLEGGRGVEGGSMSRVVQAGGRLLAGARLAWLARADAVGIEVLAASGELAEPLFEGGGAEQAAADAGEDQGEVNAVEG